MPTPANDSPIIKKQPQSPTPVSPIKATVSKIGLYVKAHKTYFISLLALAVVIIGGSLFVILNDISLTKKPVPSPIAVVTEPTPTPTPKPTPSTLYPDPGTNVGTYNVSQSKHSGPDFHQVIFNPLIINQGDELTITVSFAKTSPADKLTGVFVSDNGQQDIVFEKTGSDSQYDTWQSKFTVKDTVFYKYMVQLIAVNSAGTSEDLVAPRQ